MRPIQIASLALAALIVLAFSVFLVARYLPGDAPPARVAEESEPPAPARPAPDEARSASEAAPAAPPVSAPRSDPAFAPAPAPAPASPSPVSPLVSAPPLGIPQPTEQDIFRSSPLTAPEQDAAPGAKRGAPLSLSADQQERLRRVLESHMIMQSDAEFPLVVGAIVPEGVYLTRLPDEVADLVPNHRSYSYLFVQNRIVIVATERRQVSLLFPL